LKQTSLYSLRMCFKIGRANGCAFSMYASMRGSFFAMIRLVGALAAPCELTERWVVRRSLAELGAFRVGP